MDLIPINDFRDLRLWHWRQVLLFRDTARRLADDDCNNILDYVGMYDKRADFHIECVQMLNDAPGCHLTTAEHDDEINYRGES